jgi:hypothetical protein
MIKPKLLENLKIKNLKWVIQYSLYPYSNLCKFNLRKALRMTNPTLFGSMNGKPKTNDE